MKSKPDPVQKPVSILDRNFKYTSSANTDLAKKFKALKREQKLKAQEAGAKQTNKVTPLKRLG